MITSDKNSDTAFRDALNTTGRRTNLGHRIQVSVGGYFYTITIPEDARAYITYREGWGGLENVHINATPSQDRALRTAHGLRR